MNYHFRSYSEHQQPLQSNSNANINDSDNATNGSAESGSANDSNSNNTQTNMNNGNSINQGGVIRIYSDSQQSLDRLFNLNNTQSTVPLRSRNLPASFFNPNIITDGPQQPSSLHNRSTSFDPRRLNTQPRPTSINNSVHTRTQSTLTPSTELLSPQSNEACTNNSLHSNRNNDNAHNDFNRAALSAQPFEAQAWSSNGQNNNDTNNNNNNIRTNQNTQQHPMQQPNSQQRQTNNYHYRNCSLPTFTMSGNSPNTNQAPFYHQPPIYEPTLPANPCSNDGNFTNRSGYFYQDAASNPDLVFSSADPEQASPAPYFSSNDSVQQTNTNLNHSQPFVSYDSALGSSSMMLNPASQSSNDNHSLLGIPAPAVHSRSCSFDGRSAVSNMTHVRSKPAMVGIQNNHVPGFNQFAPHNYNSRFASISVGDKVDAGGDQMNSSANQGSSPSSTYNQTSLPPITDQGSGFDEWNGIPM